MTLLTSRQFAKKVGVSDTKIRRLHKEGKFIPYKIAENGRRLYTLEQVNEFMDNYSNFIKNSNILDRFKIAIGYCRIDDDCMKDDLQYQITEVDLYMKSKGYVGNIVTDKGSSVGLNYTGLKQIIKKVCNQEIGIVVLHQNQLTDIVYNLLDYICELHKVRIEAIHNSMSDQEQKLIGDFLQLIRAFSNNLRKQYSDRYSSKELGQSNANSSVQSALTDTSIAIADESIKKTYTAQTAIPDEATQTAQTATSNPTTSDSESINGLDLDSLIQYAYEKNTKYV